MTTSLLPGLGAWGQPMNAVAHGWPPCVAAPGRRVETVGHIGENLSGGTDVAFAPAQPRCHDAASLSSCLPPA